MEPIERPTPTEADERWAQMLLDNPRGRRNRRFHRRIPSPPRCRLCAAPFGIPGGLVMPILGHGRWSKNPKYCAGCFRMLERNHGGAEIACSLLFADVRGSTRLAERMSPREFNRLMGRFHDMAFDVLVDHDAFVDKFVGDEIIGIFVPAMAGASHGHKAIEAARDLLRRTSGTDPSKPWMPIGIGVSTGVAYVGSVGQGPDTNLTAMGDLVNTTARLASAAAAGEVLVMVSSETRDLLDGLERRTLALKGKSTPTEVAVITSTGKER
ncbi:MAG: adenylate/guanylate cyclase domain-containing protein [Candidatus Limnocylindria bacterium]